MFFVIGSAGFVSSTWNPLYQYPSRHDTNLSAENLPSDVGSGGNPSILGFSFRRLAPAPMLAVLLAGVGGAPLSPSQSLSGFFCASVFSKGTACSVDDFASSSPLFVVFPVTLVLSPPPPSSERSPRMLLWGGCGCGGSPEDLGSPLTLPNVLPRRIDPLPVGWRESG